MNNGKECYQFLWCCSLLSSLFYVNRSGRQHRIKFNHIYTHTAHTAQIPISNLGLTKLFLSSSVLIDIPIVAIMIYQSRMADFYLTQSPNKFYIYIYFTQTHIDFVQRASLILFTCPLYDALLFSFFFEDSETI